MMKWQQQQQQSKTKARMDTTIIKHAQCTVCTTTRGCGSYLFITNKLGVFLSQLYASLDMKLVVLEAYLLFFL